jgi:serine/threonine protein kinase
MEVISKIAKGSFGVCYKVKYNDTIYCQKIIDLCNPKIDNEDVKNELSFLEKINHNNIIKLVKHQMSSDLKLSLLMEFCYCSLENLRTLFDKTEFLRKRISIDTSMAIGYQLLGALNYLHTLKNPIAHLDIKDSNILINDEGIVKLIDFGLAIELENNKLIDDGMSRGTEEYQSPENKQKNKYGCAADIWSFGILMFEMMFGVLPKPTHDSYHRRKNEVFEKMECNIDQIKLFNNIFNNIFIIEQGKRITANKLLEFKSFKMNINESIENILKEINLLKKLTEKINIFKKELEQEGCLPELDIEESSSESESDSDSEYNSSSEDNSD